MSIKFSNLSLFTKSILFIIKMVFLFDSFILSNIILSPLPISSLVASIKNNTMSESGIVANDVSTIVSFNLCFGLCIPGVSVNIICEFSLFTIPFIAVLVVCTLFAIAATFSPTNKFINVDFPTFVLPIIVTNPDLNSFSIFSSFRSAILIIHLFCAKFVEFLKFL